MILLSTPVSFRWTVPLNNGTEKQINMQWNINEMETTKGKLEIEEEGNGGRRKEWEAAEMEVQ